MGAMLPGMATSGDITGPLKNVSLPSAFPPTPLSMPALARFEVGVPVGRTTLTRQFVDTYISRAFCPGPDCPTLVRHHAATPPPLSVTTEFPAQAPFDSTSTESLGTINGAKETEGHAEETEDEYGPTESTGRTRDFEPKGQEIGPTRPGASGTVSFGEGRVQCPCSCRRRRFPPPANPRPRRCSRASRL